MSDTIVLDQPASGDVVTEVRSAPKQPAIEIVHEPARTGPTPEEALASSREAIARAQEAERAATQRAQATEVELQRVRASQQQDQAAVLASAVEASTAERDRHAAAWQDASERGDWATARSHLAEMQMATSRLDRASGQLAMVKAGVQQQASAAQPPPQSGYSPKTQAWINNHSEFNRHRDALIMKHQELVNDGVVQESDRYFRELHSEYERLTGAGQRDGGRGNRMASDRGQQFDVAPPSRGSQGAGSGGRVIKTDLGDIRVRGPSGRQTVEISPHHLPDFVEGAKVARMKIEDYVKEFIDADADQRAGGTGGLITSEGRIYK